MENDLGKGKRVLLLYAYTTDEAFAVLEHIYYAYILIVIKITFRCTLCLKYIHAKLLNLLQLP